MAESPIRIEGFADACTTAFELADTFRRGHGAAVLDACGNVVDMSVFASDRYTIRDALDRAMSVVLAEPRATRVLLVSVVAGNARTLRDEDLKVFREARAALAARDAHLLDWLQSDGETMRSFAFTAGIDSWGLGTPDHVAGNEPPRPSQET